jgi:4-oxalocrotonate tautomerase
MPHVLVQVYPGHTETEKRSVADGIAQVLMEELGVARDGISVNIEEVRKESWKESVYDANIATAGANLYVKPGYTM